MWRSSADLRWRKEFGACEEITFFRPGLALACGVVQGMQAAIKGGMGPKINPQACPALSYAPPLEPTTLTGAGGQKIPERKTGRPESLEDGAVEAAVKFQEYLGTLDDDELGQLCQNYRMFKAAGSNWLAANPCAKTAYTRG